MSSIDELMQRAVACAESGDVDGEVDAYREADELGGAEAAILLGNILRRRGDLDAARAAYERAEARGHREAGMSLGNLLCDEGDTVNAKAAYFRSIRHGSTMASLNLGLMLAGMGENDEALTHLQSAADTGDAVAFWGIGKIHEQCRDYVQAAAAFRQGAALNDAGCAFGLGVALYEQGDLSGAREALSQAKELGDERAETLLDILQDDVPDIGQLWADVTGIYGALGLQRRELGRQWIAGSHNLQDIKSRLTALRAADRDIRARLETVASRFYTEPDIQGNFVFTTPVPGPVPGQWLSPRSGTGSWELNRTQSQAFDADLQEGRELLRQAESKTFGNRTRQRGNHVLGRVAKRLEALSEAIREAERETTTAEQEHGQATRAAAEKARAALEPVAGRAASSRALLPALLQPWTSPAWTAWTVEDPRSRGIRLAYGGELTPERDPQLGAHADFGTDLTVPWGFDLHDSWYLTHNAQGRAGAHAFVRSMMLRRLVSVAPGEVKFCLFDPVGLGQSVGDLLDLAEYDADLIGGKVWSSAQDLEARLVELSSHIELVIQKYLRTTYQSIDEFNDAAGEVAEPYRALVLFDSPTGLSEAAVARLKSIAENGPRCGVFTIICVDTSVQPPYGVNLDHLAQNMRRLTLQSGFVDDVVDGYKLAMAFEPDQVPTSGDIAKRVIDSIGRASIHRTNAAVTFDKVLTMYSTVAARGLRPELGRAATQVAVGDPRTWWADDSTRGLFAPIGQKGARDVAVLGFDSSDHAGALLVGRPGSGKSTLLHAYIGGLTTLYDPDELDLYLIDFKEGVEFKAYAEERLPHAKVIAIESDREFGLSVLESLQAEIAQRAEILRATGGRQAGMQGLRETTGQKIPRILLVFDEFQVLFARNDKIGLAAADLLETIIRQGRGFGVHVLLGSQSLAGLDALGAHVPQLLPVRILLPSTEADARKVLGDSNSEGDFLTGRGEGVLNTAGGAVEANQRFKGALLPEPERITRLQILRDKADQRGYTRVPMVFEGNSLVALDSHNPQQFTEELTASGTYPVRLRSGKPMTVGEIGDLTLSREAGANVLGIVRDGGNDNSGIEPAGGPAYGLLVAAVTSGAMTNAAVDVIDFMSTDDGLDEIFEPLLNTRRITLKRRRALSDVLDAYAREVAERTEQDDVRRPPKLLFLFGIHRARELDANGSLDADADLTDKLEQILRDGPEVGVHLWLWSDTVAGASRRLTARMMRELGWRIAGKMSVDDSHTFIGTGQAADLRDSQLLIVNDDRGLSTRVTAYAPPSSTWLAQVAPTAPKP